MQKARITGPLLPSAFADDASRVNGQYKLLIAGMLRSETPSERNTALLNALLHLEWLTIAWMAIEAQCRHVRNRLRLVVAFSRAENFLQTSEPGGCGRADPRWQTDIGIDL